MLPKRKVRQREREREREVEARKEERERERGGARPFGDHVQRKEGRGERERERERESSFPLLPTPTKSVGGATDKPSDGERERELFPTVHTNRLGFVGPSAPEGRKASESALRSPCMDFVWMPMRGR